MPREIGFVVLGHANANQALRLIERLNTMFDRPPVAWHHDTTQSSLPHGGIPDNVSVIDPPTRTAWGDFSLVEAIVLGLRALYGNEEGPDWFTTLSESDYPINSAGHILESLNGGGYDAHITYELIDRDHFTRDWQRVCYRRYCTRRLFSVPIINRRLRPSWKHIRTDNPHLVRGSLPFTPDFRCYAGGQWFSGNRKAAQYILAFHDERPALAAHYRTVRFADESYFQCILANAGHLRLRNEHHRYIGYSEGEHYSSPLTARDLPAMLASDCHFARKFSPDTDPALLRQLDHRANGTRLI